MELCGEAVLNASPDRVRALLNDREVMGRLLPATRDLRPVAPGTLEGALVLGVPPLGQRVPVRVTVKEEGEWVRLRVAGTGRAEGMWLNADCALSAGAAQGSTRLAYRLAAELGALGRLLGEATGARLIAGFLDGLRRELGIV